jgi:DNA-binding NarL/FixJ family response regulator
MTTATATVSRPSKTPIRLLLVDDHELIRAGLRIAFDRAGGFVVAGEARTVSGAVAQVAALQPDVIVLDINLPDGSGIEVIRELRRRYPRLGIVVLTMHAGDKQLFGALEAAASAFVSKDAPAGDVITAARHAATAPNAFAAADLAAAMRRRMSPSGPQLSRREREVLDLLAEGLGVAQIARRLYISESTAKTHVSKLYEKLKANNRAQALMAGMRLGLIGAGVGVGAGADRRYGSA